jgi:hypothetical protein
MRWHRPTLFRYQVAEPARFRPVLNRYPGHAVMGVGVVCGRYVYCVKWSASDPAPVHEPKQG